MSQQQYRVVGYRVESGQPLQALLLPAVVTETAAEEEEEEEYDSKPPQYAVVSSNMVYNEKKTTSLRPFFRGGIVPKKWIDVVEIVNRKRNDDEDDDLIPLRITKEGNISSSLLLAGTRIADVEQFFTSFAPYVGDVIPTFDTRNLFNELLFTCDQKMTEEEFVLKYIHKRNHQFLQMNIRSQFLAVYKRMGGGVGGTAAAGGCLVPAKERYFYLYFDDPDPFKQMDATMAIREIIYKKVFKHVAERLCSFLSVSLTKDEHLRRVGLDACMAVLGRPKLEYRPPCVYACYTHTLDNEGHRQRVGSSSTPLGKCSEHLPLICRTREALAAGRTKYSQQIKKKKIVLRYVPLDQPLINVPLVMVTSRSSSSSDGKYYYLCYDPIRGSILCHGTDLREMMTTQLHNMNVMFYGSNHEYARTLVVDNKKKMMKTTRIVPRSIGGPKPPCYTLMRRACTMIGRAPVIGGDNWTWYKKGSVVCETKKDMHYDEGATCFDFSNYYATVLNLNKEEIGDFQLARTVKLMSELRQQGVPSVKPDIVSILGLTKHHDESFGIIISTSSSSSSSS